MTAKPKMPPVGITVNGAERVYPDHPTIRAILAELALPERGVAVAVDGAVFAKGRWDEPVPRGAEVEILTAVQGG
jgi:sulfur carrier protein